ncbi:NAD(P)H-dependent flavin oxidoreductase [Alkalilimnicola sp. S0819]|uniref:NAD(P)H-dependent flavin oxidoreductase n=1 Tax=Alkalilimnicola sp. S0819 TaxID=2613922 RepID=UPI001261AEEC|nr:nitronate monooxygenase [Alkalilimnicola sp. S0819]KAB7623374.1 nitronate monooxygenase [Alkalilimnicola sp. S0819]MPQ16914.1 nitronate monooxygenase [Alkalilimnicola sp. S0819]
MLDTPLTRLLGIQHPILSAPMALVAGGRLAAAVSRAGGLGFIGGGYGDETWLEHELEVAGDAPIGVGFITWSLKSKPQLLDRALAHQPRALMLSFGELAPFAQRVKDADCVLLAQVQNLKQAEAAVAEGADVIIAQGTEAGGHGANRATLPLVPAIVDAVGSVPVVAAGGIADGRGVAAVLMLGASGVLMGSRFYATEESLAHPAAKAGAVEASGDDTVRSSVFDVLRGFDWPQPYTLRSVRNEMTERWHADMEDLEDSLATERPRFQAAVQEGEFRLAPLIVGEAVDLITTVPRAHKVVEDIAHEAAALLRQGPPGINVRGAAQQ